VFERNNYMKTLNRLAIAAIALIATIATACTQEPETQFYRVENGKIMLGDTPQYFIGTNVWYASRLAIEDPERLCKELDALHELGINNIRTVATDENFEGLDIVFAELRKRGMSAVLFMNNSWEWTDDAYYSYLERAGAGKQPLPKTDGYWPFMCAMAQFAANDKAVELFQDHVRRVVSRYIDEPAIFSWQICNEPRPFSEDPQIVEAFANYITSTAALIKSIDPNHMVSTGNEGIMGCNGNDMELFKRIHACPDVDYCTIHIWPYNWSWVREDAIEYDAPAAAEKINDYIDTHVDVSSYLKKPVVIEEFGYPRDGFAYENTSTTNGRDSIYGTVFSKIRESAKVGGYLAGCNFWCWSGYAKQTPGHQFWQEGDDLCGDPFQEAQGLNGVYLSDTSTIEVIRSSVKKLNKLVSVYGTDNQTWLHLGSNPFKLSITTASQDESDFQLTLDLIPDLSLMSEVRDTIYHSTKKVHLAAASSKDVVYNLGRLQPGFYRAEVSITKPHADGLETHPACAFNIGVNPEKIISEQDKQPDFDEFWESTLAELAQVPIDPEFKLLEDKSDTVRQLYEVKFSSLGGERVGGILAVPVAEGKYPVIMEYMGYGAVPYYFSPSAEPTTIQFLFTSRGQGICMDERRGWFQRGLDSKENYYYRGAYCDIVRSLDFICSFEKTDTSMIVAKGESQGGAFTWISASLDHRVKAISPSVPFMSDMPDYAKIVDWPVNSAFEEGDALGISREEILKTLSYFDVKNFTDRVQCPVYMSFGLQDPTCPPHTNFAGYNQVASEKNYYWVPTCGHSMWKEKSWSELQTDYLRGIISANCPTVAD